MKMPPAHATIAIAGATAICSLAIQTAGLLDKAALLGGFIPGRFSGAPAPDGAVPALLTPLTSTLIHGGIMHLGFNLLMLVFCGRLVEVAVGRWGVALLYFVGAYAAGLVQYLADPLSFVPTIGASGPVSALFGAYSLLYGTKTARAIGPVPARWVQVAWLGTAWIAVQALMGIATNGEVAIFAHIGGFVVGLAMARPLLLWRYRNA